MAKDPDRPEYTVYRSRPRFLRGRGGDGHVRELRGGDGRRDGARRPEYDVHRSGRRLGLPRLRRSRRSRAGRGPGRVAAGLTFGRVVRWLLLAVAGWLLLSLLLFLVSAQLQRDQVSDGARAALSDSGYTLTTPQTILVLGSDARVPGLAEPGSTIGGPSRADSIMLIRTGGGKAARLSIPRDTVVEIPGHGRDKINAAYAIGGAGLTIETIEQNFGLEVNHVVEVNFENFPEFIDALGGIDVTTKCVVSRINGGNRNGGYTLRLKRGENHINGEQALALARTRKNDCRPNEDDRTRARRQQEILASIKDRLVSPAVFARLPWVAWEAPKAVRSDMGGLQLLGVFGAIQIGGDPKTRILEPSGATTLPDGGAGLVVDQGEVDREVDRFLRG